jgi:hypothetical protein
MGELTKMLQAIVQFLSNLHSTSPAFREFCVASTFVQELFGVMFPVVCSSDHVSAETELNSRDSALTFDGGDVVIRPLVSNTAPPIVRTITVEDNLLTATGSLSERLKKGSSFVLITQEPTEYGPSSARLTPGVGSGLSVYMASSCGSNALVECLMELVMSIYEDMVFERREFVGFGLNMKVRVAFSDLFCIVLIGIRFLQGFKNIRYTLRRTCSGMQSITLKARCALIWRNFGSLGF